MDSVYHSVGLLQWFGDFESPEHTEHESIKHLQHPRSMVDFWRMYQPLISGFLIVDGEIHEQDIPM